MKVFIKTVILCCKTFLGLIEWFLRRCIKRDWTCQRIQESKSEVIHIIANGPSLEEELKHVDSNVIANYCMLNMSVVTEIFDRIKPTMYVFADPLFFTKILIGENNEYIQKFNTVDWDMCICVPAEKINQAKTLFGKNKHITIKALPSSLPKLVGSRLVRNYFYKHGMACPPLQNVVVGAIYASIMNGYKRIELYGVGHSWTTHLAVNEQNQVCLSDVHYYDLNAPMKPWYKLGGTPYKMHEVLRDLAQMFDSYWELRYFTDNLGDIEIVNHTRGSFVDAFERV